MSQIIGILSQTIESHCTYDFCFHFQKSLHLTSPQSEQVLSRACENEAENAKRMRMGMEPVSQPMPITVDQLLRYGWIKW